MGDRFSGRFFCSALFLTGALIDRQKLHMLLSTAGFVLSEQKVAVLAVTT
jgi:hypothetical protein